MARVDTDDDQDLDNATDAGQVDEGEIITENTDFDVSEDSEDADGTEDTEDSTGDGDNENTGDENTGDENTGETQPSAEKAQADAAAEEERQKALVQAFTDEVEAVVSDTEGGRDESTGVLSAALVSRVRTKYAELPAGKSRRAVKDYLADKMRAAMDDAMGGGGMDAAAFSKARSYLQLQDEALTSTKAAGPGMTKPQLSPTEQLVAHALPIWLAASAIEVPEGVEENWQQQLTEKASALQDDVAKYYTHLESLKGLPDDAEKPEAPEVDDAVLAAFRIARGRGVSAKKARASSGGSSTGATTRAPGSARGNVGEHIKQAFAKVEPGTFLTVAQIVNSPSEGAGYMSGDKPSPGAVAARLFKDGAPHTTLEGIIPGYEDPNDTDSKKGARKAS
jgi:hypothetical protein